MSDLIAEFERDGCAVVPSVVPGARLALADEYCESVNVAGAGSRDLLELPWCAELARYIRSVTPIKVLLGHSDTAVQCTFFLKNEERNWLVPLHRDYSIPVKAKVASSDWSAWSLKQSVLFARPPQPVLASLVAVRLHLEDTDVHNGALQVVSGSHRSKVGGGERSSHFVPRGGAFVMRPLLLHASSKVASGGRRVLHFVYGPAELPDGAVWAYAV
jgi:hypothetical protein